MNATARPVRVTLQSSKREMSTLDILFNRGRKRRLESLEGSNESQVSTDGSASSLIVADSECSKSDDAIAPHTPGKRKWEASWMKQYPWLQKKIIGPRDDVDVLAVCCWCREAGKQNAFSTRSSNLKVSAFMRHETRNPGHTVLVLGQAARNQGATIETILTKLCEQEARRAAEGDLALEAQFRMMYSIVNSGQPINQFNTICELQTLNGTPGFQDTKRLYTSHCSHLDLLAAINATIEEEVDHKLQASPFIGLVIDESTDVAVYKKLVIYILVVINGQPYIHYFRDVDIPNGRAETIVRALEQFCEVKGLDTAKVTSLASDGASVMVGRKSGVGTRLHSKYAPSLVQIHCVAHHLALAAANACKEFPYFDELQRTLKQVYRFYSSSPVRYNSLRKLQQVLEDNPCLRTITLKEPTSFRWLSMH